MWAQSLGQEYPLEEDMATHSSIIAWQNFTALGLYYASLSHKIGYICLNLQESIKKEDLLTQLIKTQQKQNNQQVKGIIL